MSMSARNHRRSIGSAAMKSGSMTWPNSSSRSTRVRIWSNSSRRPRQQSRQRPPSRSPRSVAEPRDGPARHGERCPELMGDVGEQSPLCCHDAFQPVEHLVEGSGELTDLVVGALVAEPTLDVALTDLLGSCRDPTDRPKETAEQEERARTPRRGGLYPPRRGKESGLANGRSETVPGR